MKIRYFAWLKQRTGCNQEDIDLPDDVTTVGELMTLIGERHPRFAEAMASKGVVRCAVNQEYAEAEAKIEATDEIAFFPPVTGG